MALNRPRKIDGEKLIEWWKENKLTIDEESGCWLTKEPREKITYTIGKYLPLLNNTKYPYTYRLFYVIRNNKPFPKDKPQAGHLCEDTSPDHTRCVNPAHIEPQDQSTNISAFQHRRKPQRQGKVLPRELWDASNWEKAVWYATDLTEEDKNGCLVYTGIMTKGKNIEHLKSN